MALTWPNFPSGVSDMDSVESEVTQLLQQWKSGDPGALERLLPMVYDQFHAIAAGYMKRERSNHTLQPTALVNEVYLRLWNQRTVTWGDQTHFFIFAARMMRNILRDHARARLADKRGGVGVFRLPLTEEAAWIGSTPEGLLDLNRALDHLEKVDARKARLVELHFFLGLTMEEAAGAMAISVATAERDLKFSRGWLYGELHPVEQTEPAHALSPAI